MHAWSSSCVVLASKSAWACLKDKGSHAAAAYNALAGCFPNKRLLDSRIVQAYKPTLGTCHAADHIVFAVPLPPQ